MSPTPGNDRANEELIARIDERTIEHKSQLEGIWKEIKSSTVQLQQSIKNVENRMNDFTVKEELQAVKDSFVLKEDFDPVRNIVYGVVGLICVAVFVGLLSLIIKSPSVIPIVNATQAK